MDVATQSNLWALTGSIYALAGAALLWASTLASPLSGALMQAADTASQRLDARFGGALLASGLFLQSIGLASNSPALAKSAVFMLLGLALLLLLYGLAKEMIIVETPIEAVVVPEAPAKRILIAHTEPEVAEITDVRPTPLRQIN